MRELMSSKLRIDFGKDIEGKSNGTWTFSKFSPDADTEQLYTLGYGLNLLQAINDVEFHRITQHKITK